jgi:uncharacterized protein with GYD domain
MAKKATVRRGKSARDDGDDVTYFFLVSRTQQGRSQRETALRRAQARVTETVRAEGGRCELYSTMGVHDYISRVTGVSISGALRIGQAIESSGNVKATMLPAIHILK